MTCRKSACTYVIPATSATVSTTVVRTGGSYQGGAGVSERQAQPPHLAGPAPASLRLPERVSVKTRTRTFNRSFYFAVRDGRIWFRANEEVTGISEPWRLLELNGRPFSASGCSADVPFRIEQITSDADELIALSDASRFYFLRLQGAGELWRGSTGVPAGILKLDALHRANRGFALGRRNRDVLYWEDPAGNPHHWGRDGISTIYFLSEDGREITIADTGLPPDTSHHIGGPERGGFVAENISPPAPRLSLSSMLTARCTPDLQTSTLWAAIRCSSTTPTPPPAARTTVAMIPQRCTRCASSRLRTGGGDPGIPLLGKARISREITILQNGHGNAAREVRVAGTDAGGHAGYYWKPLTGASWDFRPTGEEIEESRFLEPTDTHRGSGPRPAPGSDRRYQGELRIGGMRLPAELPDFNLYCSPATLRLSVGGGHADLRMFTLDAWTYATRFDPGGTGHRASFSPRSNYPTSAARRALRHRSRARSSTSDAGTTSLMRLWSARQRPTWSFARTQSSGASPGSSCQAASRSSQCTTGGFTMPSGIAGTCGLRGPHI